MKAGQLIAVDGKLYEYIKDEGDFHRVAEVEVDEDGYLTATYIEQAFTTEELQNNEVKFTKNQWYGIVGHFIREMCLYLNEEDIEDATEDIVGREFAYGIPKFHELPEYIVSYMNR